MLFPVSSVRSLLRVHSKWKTLLWSSAELRKGICAEAYEPAIHPRRCILYVPGNDERKIKKVASVGADCVVLDCEDGVALNQKDNARNLISEKLKRGENFGRTELSVRINSIDSGLAEKDLQTILQSGQLPSAIFVPKVNDVSHIDWVAEKFTSLLKYKKVSSKIQLLIYTESARGLLNLQNICQQAQRLSKEVHFTFAGIVFGSDDFCANIGANRTIDAKEVLYARQHILVVAKAFGIQAIDLVFINYKDLDGLKRESLEGASYGYTGKQVIHPSQVPVVQKAFSPSEEKIEWAMQLTKAFEEQQQLGKGAFSFQGQMIDKPLLLQAKNIIALASCINK